MPYKHSRTSNCSTERKAKELTEQKMRSTFFPYNRNQLLIRETSLKFEVRITHTSQCKCLDTPLCSVTLPGAAARARTCPGHSAEHSWWDPGSPHPLGPFWLQGKVKKNPWGEFPMVLTVLGTFEILDSEKKHPFFLQKANGKSNFSKINKKCIEVEIYSSGCSPEWTPSTKSVCQSWQPTGWPSSLQHDAADQTK